MILKRIEQWDHRSFCRLFTRSSSRTISKLSFYISKSADGPAYILLCGVLFLVGYELALELTTILLLAFAIELPLYLVLKNGIKRTRPSDSVLAKGLAHIIPSDKFSLPSGHTAGAFVVGTMLIVYFPILTILAVVWASGVGLSRIMLGVHFPLDIIAGAILGTACSLSAYVLLA